MSLTGLALCTVKRNVPLVVRRESESRHFSPGMRHLSRISLSLCSVFPTLSPLGVCLENATRSGRVVHVLLPVVRPSRASKRSTLTCCPDPDTVRTRGSATVSPHQELSIPRTKVVNIEKKKRPWYEIKNHCGSRKAARLRAGRPGERGVNCFISPTPFPTQKS